MAAPTSELQAQKHSGKGEGETVGIALLGFGTVGAEVFRLLGENADAFTHRIGAQPRFAASPSKIRISCAQACPRSF